VHFRHLQVMGLMFLASLKQLTQIHQCFSLNDKPHSFSVESNYNIQKKTFQSQIYLFSTTSNDNVQKKNFPEPDLFTYDYIRGFPKSDLLIPS
jgi:hypothetical protein